MKKGDIIGIGENTHVNLVCRVIEVTPEHLKFWVMNGAWTGYLTPNGKLDAGNEWTNGKFELVNTVLVSGQKVIFTGRIPKYAGGYQAIFDHMNDYLSRPWIVRKWRDFSIGVSERVGKLTKRLRLATTAFCDSWAGRGHTIDGIPY